jgi:hypothetical protein
LVTNGYVANLGLSETRIQYFETDYMRFGDKNHRIIHEEIPIFLLHNDLEEGYHVSTERNSDAPQTKFQQASVIYHAKIPLSLEMREGKAQNANLRTGIDGIQSSRSM